MLSYGTLLKHGSNELCAKAYDCDSDRRAFEDLSRYQDSAFSSSKDHVLKILKTRF